MRILSIVAAFCLLLLSSAACSDRNELAGPDISASVDWVRSQSIAAESGCFVYALGAGNGPAIFVSCNGEPPRQVQQNEICLHYSNGVFAGTCVASATCISTGQIGAFGPIYTGSCAVP